MLRSRLCYLSLLLGTGSFYVCFNGYISYYVFLLSLALPFVSLLLSLPGMATLRVRLLLQGEEGVLARTRKGASLPLSIEASTPWPLPSGQVRLRLTVENTLTGTRTQERLVLALGGQPLVLEHALTSPACGLVTCTVSRVWASDLLGLFSLPVPMKGRGRSAAFFYPRACTPALSLRPQQNPDSEGERYSLTKPGDDLSELFGLRDYRQGDKLSRIHWKLSQKTGRTLVKEPSLPLADSLLFLLDLNGQGEEADALLDVFATLSGFLIQQEAAHRVGYQKDGLLVFIELAGPEDARPALEAVLAAGGRATLPPLREEDLPRGVSHVLYLCCTPDPDLARLARRRYPSARFTGLCTGEAGAQGLPGFYAAAPGQMAEALNGMEL